MSKCNQTRHDDTFSDTNHQSFTRPFTNQRPVLSDGSRHRWAVGTIASQNAIGAVRSPCGERDLRAARPAGILPPAGRRFLVALRGDGVPATAF